MSIKYHYDPDIMSLVLSYTESKEIKEQNDVLIEPTDSDLWTVRNNGYPGPQRKIAWRKHTHAYRSPWGLEVKVIRKYTNKVKVFRIIGI